MQQDIIFAPQSVVLSGDNWPEPWESRYPKAYKCNRELKGRIVPHPGTSALCSTQQLSTAVYIQVKCLSCLVPSVSSAIPWVRTMFHLGVHLKFSRYWNILLNPCIFREIWMLLFGYLFFPIQNLFLQPQCHNSAFLIFRKEFTLIWKEARTGTNEKHLRNAAFLSQ